MKLFYLFTFISFSVFAARKPAVLNKVWADITKAHYKVKLSPNQKAQARSILYFNMKKEGQALFLAPKDIMDVKLNNKTISVNQYNDKIIIYKHLKKGSYKLEVNSVLNQSIKTNNQKTSLHLLKNDFFPNKGLNQYFVTGRKTDIYSSKIEIDDPFFEDHQIISNGEVVAKTIFQFKKHNSHSIYFHYFPKGDFKIEKKIIGGVEIIAYSKKTKQLLSKVERILRETSQKFGELPYKKFIYWEQSELFHDSYPGAIIGHKNLKRKHFGEQFLLSKNLKTNWRHKHMESQGINGYERLRFSSQLSHPKNFIDPKSLVLNKSARKLYQARRSPAVEPLTLGKLQLSNEEILDII